MKSTNLIDILVQRCMEEDKGITFIEGSKEESFLSYSGLYHAALKALAFFQVQGLRPKDELVFQTEDNRSFVIAFWGCILGGIIPVPLTVGKNDDHRQKLFNVWPVLGNPHLLIAEEDYGKLKKASFGRAGISIDDNRVVDIRGMADATTEAVVHHAEATDTAFIQFSSGSTGKPKGVIVTHKSLLSNMAAIAHAGQYIPSDTTINWMPLTHDMGLIGFHLNPVFSGMHQYLMPVSLFIRRPGIWMDKATEHKATILCSPNFGYEYVIKHCQDTANYHWDLSHVRLLYNGAEPISERLCRRFLEKLAACGLRSNVMCPVYGLAEATLAVSFSALDDEVMAIAADRNSLNIGDKVRLNTNAEDAVSFVNLGKVVNDCCMRITTDDDIAVAEEIIGHVQISGENVTSGYYNNEHATKELITADGWLRTGDVGFIRSDVLYLTGRAKDIIFINGQNYYPSDIENVAEDIEGISLNKVAIAGLFDPILQKEEMLAFVLHRDSMEAFVPVATALRQAVSDRIGVQIKRVIPVKNMPRTTSGKLQRFRLVEQLKNGEYEEVEARLNTLYQEQHPQVVIALPENEYESRLLEIWKSALANPFIGVTSKFFEAGGNSLKAAEMSMYVLKEMGLELPVGLVYEKQSIRELAGVIDDLNKQQYSPIPVSRAQAYYPLSSAQKRLYYIWETDKSSIAYNIPVAFEIKGNIDKERLEKALNKMIARHDMLRASFHNPNDPLLKIAEEVTVTLEYRQVSRVQLAQYLSFAVQPFNLNIPSLFRACLIKVQEQEHVLFTDFHHIIADGVSVHRFIEELFGIYHGNSLPSLPVQYKDYTCWEEDDLRSERMISRERYWLDHLQGDLPVLELPLDLPRPAVFNTKGAKIAFNLDPATAVRLRALAGANNCTMHVLLFAVYQVLLAKYTGQDDIVTGIPVSDRRHPDLQHLMGMFVNNLVIRNSIRAGEPFNELLKRVGDNIRQALDNADYPYGHLIEKIKRRRDMSRNQFFDTMFIYQHMTLGALSGSGLSVSQHTFDPGFAKFDLSMEIFDDGQSIRCGIEYASSLFREETVQRIAAYFTSLADKLSRDPLSRPEDLYLISQNEYADHIGQFNARKVAYPDHKTIYALFEEQAVRTPGAIALEYKGETVTYNQLKRKTENLAAILADKGMIQNGIVCILLPRSAELVISILAVLRAGGTYLPVDTDLPAGRINYLISDSRCDIVITDRKQQIDTSFSGTVINIDDTDLNAAKRSPDKSKPEALAYVIYTSGTTGKPKGVTISHASLVNYIWWAARYYVKGRKVDFPLFSPVSFDLTVTSIFTPLITGNRIVIYGEADNEVLIERIVKDDKVDIIKLTPSHLKLLASSGLALPGGGSRIKGFIVGGEALTYDLSKNIYDKFGGKIEIYNEYGPTEATVGCMIQEFDPDLHLPVVPIGVPIDNTQIYLLDRFLQPVPRGVPGEIYIAGDGLANGYLFNEPLTSERFIPCPFLTGKKMYRTGDVGVRLADGTLQYIGRSDEQVKISGYRIELAEIAHNLKEYPGIEDALITVRKNEKGQQYLCAYYTTAGEDIHEGQIRAVLASALPYYMIPAYFIRVEKIGLTKNGKADYSSLPAPDLKRKSERILPENKIASLLLAIWKDVLQLKELSVDDNFFEAGGDSIKATQIVTKLAGHGMQLRVKDILIYHTIAGILPYVQMQDATQYEQGIVEGERALIPVESWFFQQALKNPHYFNQSVLLQLKLAVNISLLETAFSLVIKQHDGLRTNYDPQREVMFYNRQYLYNNFIIDEHILSGDNDLIEICKAAKNSFDITGSLLLKAIVIRNDSNDDSLLFITAHHLVMDGVSWRILLEDLHTLYNALEAGKDVPVLRKTATLRDWQQQLTRSVASGMLKVDEAYWDEVAATAFSLPQDFETMDWKTENIQMIFATLDLEKEWSLIKKASRIYGADIPVVLNLALALALEEWMGGNCFVIEQENHGRHLEDVDTSRTIGWFTTMYPLRLQLTAGDLNDQIMSVKEQLRRVPENGIGYGISRHMKRGRKPGRAAIRLNYLGQFGQELDNDLFTYSHAFTGSNIDPCNDMTAILEFDMMIRSEKLHLHLKYNKEAYRKFTVNHLVNTFINNINRVLAHIKEENTAHFTPSDFDTVALDQEDLNTLFQ